MAWYDEGVRTSKLCSSSSRTKQNFPLAPPTLLGVSLHLLELPQLLQHNRVHRGAALHGSPAHCGLALKLEALCLQVLAAHPVLQGNCDANRSGGGDNAANNGAGGVG